MRYLLSDFIAFTSTRELFKATYTICELSVKYYIVVRVLPQSARELKTVEPQQNG